MAALDIIFWGGQKYTYNLFIYTYIEVINVGAMCWSLYFNERYWVWVRYIPFWAFILLSWSRKINGDTKNTYPSFETARLIVKQLLLSTAPRCTMWYAYHIAVYISKVWRCPLKIIFFGDDMAPFSPWEARCWLDACLEKWLWLIFAKIVSSLWTKIMWFVFKCFS